MESESPMPPDFYSDGGHPASEQLRAVEQAEALVYTRYPPLGRWYPAVVGSWAAGLVAAYAAPTWLSIVLLGGLVVAAGAGTGWYLRKRGVMPNLRGAPPAIKREMTVFFVGYVVVIASVVATYRLASWWVASILAFTMVTSLIAVYEARYADAARRDEADLGITPAVSDPV